jgi:predicted dehydrogenase
MSENQSLRVAVTGGGYWGSKHVRTFHSLDSVDSVVLVEPRQERVAELQHVYPGMVAVPDLDSALDLVDAVVVATPPSTHAPLALRALEAGKHVMVEKPFATRLRDALAMKAAAEQRGLVLMVGHTFEYHAAVWRLREMVDKAELGDLYYVDTARLNLGLYQRDVDVILDLAPHDISILNYVLRSQPVAVECWASRHAHQHLEDIAYLRLFYDRPNLLANVHVSWLDPCKVRRMTMVGSSKMAVFDDLATEERIKVHNKGVVVPDDSDLTMPPMSYRYGEVVSPYLAFNEPLAIEDEHFVDCVLTGMTPLTGADNGIAVVEVLEAAERSKAQHRVVRLDEMRESTPTPAWVPVQPVQRDLVEARESL